MNNTIYALLSSQRLVVNGRTVDKDFMLGQKLIHGSFFVNAYVKAQVSQSEVLTLGYDSDESDVVTYNRQSQSSSSTTTAALPLDLEFEYFHVSVTKELMIIEDKDWSVTIKRDRAYGSFDNSKRLDVKITLKTPVSSLRVAPHGILGQSFDGDGIAVNGKKDDYSSGHEIRTSSMAEEL